VLLEVTGPNSLYNTERFNSFHADNKIPHSETPSLICIYLFMSYPLLTLKAKYSWHFYSIHYTLTTVLAEVGL
jgi:hypothetical protein